MRSECFFLLLSSTLLRTFHGAIMDELLHVRPNESFLWYPPHSGFGNQLQQFRNALRLSALLNRTLIVPPVLDHYDVDFGSCANDRVRSNGDLRRNSWEVISKKLRSPSYTSMADIIDISDIAPDLIRTVDFRIYASVHCGVDSSLAVKGCSWCEPLKKRLAEFIPRDDPLSSQSVRLYRCGHKVGAMGGPGAHLVSPISRQVAVVSQKCTNTRWTYFRGNNSRRNLLPVKSDRSESPGSMVVLDVVEELGSMAAGAPMLAMGSTMNYFDLEFPEGSDLAARISQSTALLPFVSEIMAHGVAMAHSPVLRNGEFACLHVRVGDSFFKSSKSEGIKTSRAELLKLRSNSTKKTTIKPLLFVITDIYNIGEQKKLKKTLEGDGWKVLMPFEVNLHEQKVSHEVLRSRHGLWTNRVATKDREMIQKDGESVGTGDKLPEIDVQMFLQQVICSCANIGFVGRRLSSFSDVVLRLRSAGLYSSKNIKKF